MPQKSGCSPRRKAAPRAQPTTLAAMRSCASRAGPSPGSTSCGRGRTPRHLACRARAPSAGGLRVPCRGPGPQRARRLAGRRRPRPAGRARADLAARAERAAGLGGCRRGHRAPGPGARPPDADHNPRGRQGGDHPARAAHCPGDRPGHRRTHRRAGVPGRGRSATGQARRRPDRRKTARRAGIGKTVTPHTLRHAFITAALDAGVPLRDVQEAASHADPRTTMRYDRASGSLDRHATYIVAAYVAGAAR